MYLIVCRDQPDGADVGLAALAEGRTHEAGLGARRGHALEADLLAVRYLPRDGASAWQYGLSLIAWRLNGRQVAVKPSHLLAARLGHNPAHTHTSGRRLGDVSTHGRCCVCLPD
jgi:hypothetical protein